MYFRFIPAFAGNTLPLGELRSLDAVHPRVCGEHPIQNRDKTGLTGSSPRLRGTLLHLTY